MQLSKDLQVPIDTTIQTSWLLKKYIYTNYYKIILYQEFLISFQAYTLSKSPKTAIFHNLKLEEKRGVS